MKRHTEVYLSSTKTIKVDLGMVDDMNDILDNLEYYARKEIEKNNFEVYDESKYEMTSATVDGKFIKFSGEDK